MLKLKISLLKMDDFEGESRSFKTIPVSSQKHIKMMIEPKLNKEKELYNLNNGNNLIDSKVAKKKKKSPIKRNNPYLKYNALMRCFDHYDNNCKICQGINKLMEYDRSKLSSYIEDNSPFLKLFGNQRYDHNSPILFVKDHKNKIDARIGIIPIP